MRTFSALLTYICCLWLLAACEQLGIDDPAKIAAAKDAEGKAVGSACRYSARTLEECYALNPRALKSAVFAGWLTMDGYMRDNKIEPQQAGRPASELKPPEGKGSAEAKAEGKPAEAKPPAEKH